ncbi:MAG: YeiH family protein [Desulfovibrionaceae bacterium]
MAGQTNGHADVVVDKGKSSWSDLWKKEDYWAIWLAFGLLAVGMMIFLPRPPADMDDIFATSNAIMAEEAQKAPFKTIEYLKAQDAKGKVVATSLPYAKTIASYLAHPQGWSANPLDSFMLSQEAVDAKNAKAMPKYEAAKAAEETSLASARAAQAAASDAEFKDEQLNLAAKAAIADWRIASKKASDAKKKTTGKGFNLVPKLIALGVLLGLFYAIGMLFMGHTVGAFLKGFGFVFLVAVGAYVCAQQATVKHYGIEYAAWAVLFGMAISNTVGTPKWVLPAAQTEYFIKTGLVLLGAEVLFNKVVAIGIPGIFVAWVVTPIVLVSTFIFGQKVLKMESKTLNITISADMSVCGVSAAIATAAACRAKKEELTLAVGLSLVFTAIMMVLMPLFIKAVGMPHVLGGAWMGGTIDSTGAVAAAGAFLSEQALYVAATIKMIQNVLIGVTAFCVAVYWCYKVDCVPGQTVSAWEIWHRFPKFVLGFLAASVIFSFIFGSLGSDVGNAMLDHGVLRGFTRPIREWSFCLAFTSIGLATNFRELGHYFKGGKPLILYVCGQSFNLALTLGMAYVMFYKVFPEITASI